jgi:SSS family solute:Na+ symporter
MITPIRPIEIIVCLSLLILTTAIGISARWWRRGKQSMTGLGEWGLGGRQFGTWVTWFLLGGDFYTAYTVIAIPALVYGTGGAGFFALPYTIIVYPIVFATMPQLWSFAHRNGCVTAADMVQVRYGSRTLALVVALTGCIATMPYIALQLVGLEIVSRALGLSGEVPLLIAFFALALYTYLSGLRAPALIALVKDLMIYIVVLAAVAVIPAQLGGYATMFHAAERTLATHGSGSLLLAPAQVAPYGSLAFGSALAAFLYPHTLTGVFAARSADIIRRNAILLPAYTLVLGMIALMGYMALASGIAVAEPNDVVPALLGAMFPPWFVGFALAAIAVSALVPATVMSIGAASLISRNVWRAYVNPAATAQEETTIARRASLLMKIGALLFVIFLPVKYAVYLQLLGGLWILQTLPAVILGIFIPSLSIPSLIAGWLVGIVWGTWIVFADGLVPVHQVSVMGQAYGIYTGLLALALNVMVTLLGTVSFASATRISFEHLTWRGMTRKWARPVGALGYRWRLGSDGRK